MKYLVLLTLIMISHVYSDAIPSTGLFAFTPYTDDKCTLTNNKIAGVYNSDMACWNMDPNSSKASAWNPTTKQITLDFYSGIICSGTATSTASVVPCDGTCNKDTLNAGMYYTCNYINIPKTTTFAFTTFSENTCKTRSALPVGLYSGANICWKTSATTSMVPLSWDGSKVLTLFAYGANGNCFGSTAVSAAGPINCDGSCLQDAFNTNQWYSCVAISMPDGKFTISGFQDASCATAVSTPPGVYDNKQLCWITGPTTSILPTSYNTSDSTLTQYQWGSSGTCSGDVINLVGNSWECDGTCTQDAFNKALWGKCTYMPLMSANFLTGLVLTLLLFVLWL